MTQPTRFSNIPDFSSLFIKIDKKLKYVPILSSMANIINGIQKIILFSLDKIQITPVFFKDNKYFTYIKERNGWSCAKLVLPWGFLHYWMKKPWHEKTCQDLTNLDNLCYIVNDKQEKEKHKLQLIPYLCKMDVNQLENDKKAVWLTSILTLLKIVDKNINNESSILKKNAILKLFSIDFSSINTNEIQHALSLRDVIIVGKENSVNNENLQNLINQFPIYKVRDFIKNENENFEHKLQLVNYHMEINISELGNDLQRRACLQLILAMLNIDEINLNQEYSHIKNDIISKLLEIDFTCLSPDSLEMLLSIDAILRKRKDDRLQTLLNTAYEYIAKAFQQFLRSDTKKFNDALENHIKVVSKLKVPNEPENISLDDFIKLFNDDTKKRFKVLNFSSVSPESKTWIQLCKKIELSSENKNEVLNLINQISKLLEFYDSVFEKLAKLEEFRLTQLHPTNLGLKEQICLLRDKNYEKNMKKCLPENYPIMMPNFLIMGSESKISIKNADEFKKLVNAYATYFENLAESMNHLKKMISNMVNFKNLLDGMLLVTSC